jgi:hypothetical protein
VAGVDVELLTVPDCPSRTLARQRIVEAFAAAGFAVPVIVERVIDTPQAAVAAGMHGSPTILIDGTDPFADASGEPSLSCRLYAAAAGLAGAPGVEDLVAALARGDHRDR